MPSKVGMRGVILIVFWRGAGVWHGGRNTLRGTAARILKSYLHSKLCIRNEDFSLFRLLKSAKLVHGAILLAARNLPLIFKPSRIFMPIRVRFTAPTKSSNVCTK